MWRPGNGNTALAASRRGAVVTALDPSQAQIERGRRRARIESRPIAWVRGDGRRLPFADSSFDSCLDSFGEEMPVVEMVRVVRSRGVVGIAEWTGEGFFGAYVELIRSFSRGRIEASIVPISVRRTSSAPAWRFSPRASTSSAERSARGSRRLRASVTSC